MDIVNKSLVRKQGKKFNGSVLIICEGKKTEVNYFNEIRINLKKSKELYKVIPANGTDPLSVVKSALEQNRHIKYDKIFVVFDRDDHEKYWEALNLLEKNKNITPIISVSCFEFWLLLHFEDQTQFIDRHSAFSKLKIYIPNYHKAQAGIYSLTMTNYIKASERAYRLRSNHSYLTGNEAYTNVDNLVDFLFDKQPR